MRIARTLPPAAAPLYPKEIVAGLKGLLNGKKKTDRFKSEIQSFFNVKHIFLVSSGKAALTIILKALNEITPEKNKVVIPAFTCYSVPSAIYRAGLKVKLCDINPDSLDFDLNKLCDLVSDNKIVGVVPTHLFGLPSNIDKLRECLKNSDITVIEDAAQAMGSEFNGNKAGISGDVSFFSLGRGKALSTVEGGIILTNRSDIACAIEKHMGNIDKYSFLETIKLILNALFLSVFLHPKFFWLPCSLPFLNLGKTVYDTNFKIKKMTGFQAGISSGWQEKLKQLIINRSKNSNTIYNKLNKSSNCKLFHTSCDTNNLIRFPIKIINEQLKADIIKKSRNLGLGIMPSYPTSVNKIDKLKNRFANQQYPVAEKIAATLITVPTHCFLKQKDIKKIISNLI